MTMAGTLNAVAGPRTTTEMRTATGMRSATGPRGATGMRSAAELRDSVLPGTEALASGPRRRVPATVLSLLGQARQGLAEAKAVADPGTRYICAHLAALRAAAAIVAARVEPGAGSRRHRPRSVWELLPQADPALSEWAAFFAASAAKRAAAEAGLPRAATAREAEDLIRDAETFLRVAERALGVDGQPLLPLRPAS
jgi:SAV_6107-like HEPN